MSDITLIIDGHKKGQSEQEYFPNSEYGFNVHEYYADGKMRVFHNVTEIHWRYKGDQRAYESDHHQTGSCWYLESPYNRRVIAVVAVEAEEMNTEF